MLEWLVKCPHPKCARIKGRTDGLINKLLRSTRIFHNIPILFTTGIINFLGHLWSYLVKKLSMQSIHFQKKLGIFLLYSKRTARIKPGNTVLEYSSNAVSQLWEHRREGRWLYPSGTDGDHSLTVNSLWMSSPRDSLRTEKMVISRDCAFYFDISLIPKIYI